MTKRIKSLLNTGILFAGGIALVFSTGCATNPMGSMGNMGRTGQGAALGTLIGAAAGAGIAERKGREWEGAAIGAALGGLGGAVAGSAIGEHQRPESAYGTTVRTKSGAVLGALAGAGIGAIAGESDGRELEGAGIGAAVGAIGGMVMGGSMDRRAEAIYGHRGGGGFGGVYKAPTPPIASPAPAPYPAPPSAGYPAPAGYPSYPAYPPPAPTPGTSQAPPLSYPGAPARSTFPSPVNPFTAG